MAKIQTGTWRDLGDAQEKLGLGEPPPSGLVPVGDTGLYTTPDTPADPRDCDRYPDSPYCGGNPFTKTPVGIEVSTTLDIQPCGVTKSISVTPVFGFIKLPPVTAAHIPENCREEYEKQGKQTPPPPLPGDMDNYEPTPQYAPYGFPPDATVCVVMVDSVYDETQEYNWVAEEWRKAVVTATGSVIETKYPSDELVHWYNQALNGTELINPVASVKGIVLSTGSFNKRWAIDVWGKKEQENSQETHFIDISIPPDYPSKNGYQVKVYFPTGSPGLDNIALYVGRFGAIFPKRQISPVVSAVSNDNRKIRRVFQERAVVYCKAISGDLSDRRPPPLKPPKKKCCEDSMGCCQPSHNNKQDQDLGEIKKMLMEIKKRLGTDEYPVAMPETLNVKYDDKGKRTEPKMIREENLTGVVGRFIRYFDGVIGEFGLGFKVADADPTKPGDQPKFITANNISELLEELYSHIFDMWIQNYQFLQLNQRHAMESMLARKVGIQNYYLLQSIVDWCGFKTKDITKKIPFLFNIDAEGFEDFLKNKEQEIQVPDFDPDDKGSDSFPDQLIRLNRAAAIIEAVHTTKFKRNDDIPKKMMEMLLNTSKAVDRVNNDELKAAGSKEDFDQWLRDAETAFISRIGQGDINNPYGVPYSQRPRLTKITEEDPTPGDGE